MKTLTNNKIHFYLIITIISIQLLSCSNSNNKSEINSKKKYCLDKKFKEEIKIENPQNKLIIETIPLTGTIEPNQDKVVNFVSLVSGVISNVYFSLGDKVTKGQVLAEVKSSQLSELQSQLKTIESQLKVAERKLQSIQEMYNGGVASQKDLLEARSEIEILKAEKEKINSNLNLFSASSEKKVFQIKSPVSGIITSKSISAGMQISEGEALFTVSDLSEVWVSVNIYATNLKNIEVGMKVNIKTLSYPDDIIQGRISKISQVLDEESKIVKARVVLQNKDLKLKPGMIVDVTALKEQNIKAISIPTSAIIFDNNKNYVLFYKDDCNIEIRAVNILATNDGTTYISSGLSENDKIITKNQLLIYEQIKNFNY